MSKYFFGFIVILLGIIIRYLVISLNQARLGEIVDPGSAVFSFLVNS